MSYDTEERDAETRKLEALVSIGTSLTALSQNLTLLFRETMDQSSLLRRVEGKLDRVLEALAAKDLEDVERG